MTTLPLPLPAGNAGPRTVRALIGDHCDGDPAAEAVELTPLDLAVSPDLLVPFDLSIVDAPPPSGRSPLDADDPEPADTTPPFPEPPADLPYWTKDAEKMGIFRTAWPHLSADQRAEVERLVGCLVRSGERNAAEQARQAEGPPKPTPLMKDWFELSASVARAGRDLAAHSAGWVASADELSDPDDDAWPHDVTTACEAAGWVLANIGGSLHGEVCGWWGDQPHHFVFPLAPLAEPDADALPAEWDGRRDKLAELVAMMDDLAADLGRCLEQQELLPEFDPVGGSMLDTLGGGRLALEAAVDNLRSDLHHEVKVATARRDLARLRIAKRIREADAERAARAA